MNHNLALELNEITVLMGISSVGIITVMGLSIFIAFAAFFGRSEKSNN